MSFPTELFINNEFVAATSGKTFEVRNPKDNTHIANVHSAGPEDVEKTVLAASSAFKGPWRKMSTNERAACLYRLADLVEENAEELAAAETAAMGAPTIFGKTFIVNTVAPTWRYYAGWCDKIAGESYPVDGDGLHKIVQYEPLGVCAAISAWNGTHLSIVWKVAAAVAAGNTVIHKSSEKSPFGSLVMGKLVAKAGFPPGVINFINGAGDTGALLASHMKIAKISFTGSTAVGRRIQEAATKSNMKRVTLELGGKSPSIVFDDADMELALTENSFGFLINSGQSCTAGSRLFVQESIAKDFVNQLKDRFVQLAEKMGDPTDPDTMFGPVVDEAQFNRIMGLIASGRDAGGQVVAGGARKGDKGFFVPPTLFLQAGESNPIYENEIFGPVLTLNTFKTEEEVIELANNTPYGLSSYLFTKDLSRALRVSSQIEAGMVNVNTHQNIVKTTPFGGYKESGQGRESGKAGMMAYLNVKTITIKV